jgi:hypothetical protein
MTSLPGHPTAFHKARYLADSRQPFWPERTERVAARLRGFYRLRSFNPRLAFANALCEYGS